MKVKIFRTHILAIYRRQRIGQNVSWKLQYIVGIGLVQIAIYINLMPMIYCAVYENTGSEVSISYSIGQEIVEVSRTNAIYTAYHSDSSISVVI